MFIYVTVYLTILNIKIKVKTCSLLACRLDLSPCCECDGNTPNHKHRKVTHSSSVSSHWCLCICVCVYISWRSALRTWAPTPRQWAPQLPSYWVKLHKAMKITLVRILWSNLCNFYQMQDKFIHWACSLRACFCVRSTCKILFPSSKFLQRSYSTPYL